MRCRRGREVRVMVKLADVDDLAAQVLARDMAKQVEEEAAHRARSRSPWSARRVRSSTRSSARLATRA